MGKIAAADINILLVEDDEVDTEAVKRAFKKRGMENHVHHAACGVEALEILRGENGKEKIAAPYIMLVDLNMPKMGGIEFLQEVRKDQALCHGTIFVLTTSSREADIEASSKLNVAGYFIKDSLNDLMDMLQIYLRTNRFSVAA